MSENTTEQEVLAEKLESVRDSMKSSIVRHISAVEAGKKYAEAFDKLLKEHSESLVSKLSGPPRFALLAVGGYGRRELNLRSDIDTLFVFFDEPDAESEEFIKAFLYPFWNLRFDLSYSVKSISQILSEIEEDIELTTTLIGMKFIWGTRDIYSQLTEQFRARISLRFESLLTEKLIDLARQRHLSFDETAMLLEPSVKDAPGGLRDIHSLRWLSFIRYGHSSFAGLVSNGLLSSKEEHDLRRAHNFFLELRNSLHMLEDRKVDVLSVERQIRIARLLGLTTTHSILPEEQLMRMYYGHAHTVVRTCRRVLFKIDQENDSPTKSRSRLSRGTRVEGQFWRTGDKLLIDPKEVGDLTRDPTWMMHFFSVIALNRLDADDITLDMIERHTDQITQDFRHSTVNRDRFLMILKNEKHAGRTLRLMHESRFLETYMPEFKAVRHLPRIDYYHQFTVDEHLLRAVECACELFDETSAFGRTHVASIARQLFRWDLLVLALLLHDIGKGEGRGHVIRGAHMVQRIAKRMGLSKRETGIVHRLVLDHHKMSMLALKRNPEDPSVARELAKDIAQPELLRMLYVLTCCDLRAVSNESWNEWRGSLLQILFERSIAMIQGQVGDEKPPTTNHQLVREVMAVIEGDCGDGSHGVAINEETVESIVSELPERYTLSTPPELVARHCVMAGNINEENLVELDLELTEESSYSILHCISQDEPGLFCQLCGALTARGLNILSAQIYTARDGFCVDIFQIQDRDGNPVTEQDMFVRMKEKLNRVLRGDVNPSWKDQIRQKIPAVSTARLDLRPPTVSISNDEATEGYTVLEVRAPDRPGLLFDITSVLHQRRINIHFALVATEAYQVVDVFYVTDWDNHRLEPGQATETLNNDLLNIIAPSAPIRSEPSQTMVRKID